MGCPNLDGEVGQDCGEGPQSSAPRPACGPRPRSSCVPIGWGPCPQGRAVCAQHLLQPPSGKGDPGPGSSLGRPTLTGFPPPQPTPKRTQLRTHPPTAQSCPEPPKPRARSGGPRTRCGPCPLGPCSRGGDGSGGHGCVADRFLDSSARPWGVGELGQGCATWVPRPRGVPGAAPPGSVVSRPTQLPLGPPACCPLSPGCALRLPTSRLVTPTFAGGGGVSPDLSLPKLCAAATGSIFFKNRMDVRKTTIPQNHTQGWIELAR